MEESQSPNCYVCGGSEFMIENGYFYCQECQTQCEDIREQLFEEQDNDNLEHHQTQFTLRKQKEPGKKKRKGKELTSWEIHNFILRGLVDELLVAGAPPSLKDTMLQMWCYYLHKTEVAFVSKDKNVLPKLGISYVKDDAKLLFGLKEKKAVKTPRTSSVYPEMSTTLSEIDVWSSQQIKKKMRGRSRRALINKSAEASILEADTTSLDQSDEQSMSEFNDTSSLMSQSSVADSTYSDRFQRSEAALEWLMEVTGEMNDVLLKRKGLRRNWTDSLSIYKLVVFLYLALLYEKSKIQISDLMRWMREGHLSYNEAAKFLPDTCFVQGGYHYIFCTKERFPSYEIFLYSAGKMSHFFQMKNLPMPVLSELAKKYVQELELPEMLSDIVVRFGAWMPQLYTKHKEYEIPNYEARVLAMIIIILKILFGLDGNTEKQISKAASQFNKFQSQKGKDPKLFVWNHWIRKLICRDAVLSKYHFPTKHLLCPEEHGNPQTFINYHNKWNDANAGLQDKYNILSDDVLKVCQPALLNTFMSFLDKLQDNGTSNNDNIDFPQCFTPYSTYIKKVLEKSSQMDEPLLDKSAVEILTQDFSNCDISYLLKPNILKKGFENKDVTVKVKYKSAQKKCVKFKSEKLLKHSCAFKLHCYVKVTKCKGGRCVSICASCSDSEHDDQKSKGNEMEKKKKKEKDGCANNVDCPNLVLSSKSRKRKKRSCASQSSKKRKPMASVKLYVPCSEYWVHVDNLENSESHFEVNFFRKFPFSFAWLLTECALVSEMSKFTLYKEVSQMEKQIQTKKFKN